MLAVQVGGVLKVEKLRVQHSVVNTCAAEATSYNRL